MRTLSAAADLATKKPSAGLLYLLQIDFTAPFPLTVRFSDHYVRALGQEWLPFVASWDTLEDVLNTQDADGRPATGSVTFFNTKPIEGKARLSDLIRTPLNTAGTFEFAFAKATVYQLFEGLDTGDEVPIGVFFLEDPTEMDETLLTIRMSDQALVIENRLKVTTVSRAEFPNAADSAIGQTIRRAFGVLTGVPLIPVVDSAVSPLFGAITSTATSLILENAAQFAASGTLQIDSEHLTYSGKSGNSLTGLARGQNTTTAAAHVNHAQVYQVRTGVQAYRYAVSEHAGNFKIRTVKNVSVDGNPPAHPPTIELEDTTLVSGKNFAMISFPSEAKFFEPAAVSAQRDVAVSTISFTFSGGSPNPASPQTRTVSPSSVGGTTSTDRSMNVRIVRGGNLAGTVNSWVVKRRLSGGGDVTVATGSYAAQVGGTQSFSDSRTYASTADEVITFELIVNNTNDGTLDVIFDNYHVIDHSNVMAGGGPTSIGEVTADLEGLQDDATGTISGTAGLLLRNPTDVTKLIVTQLYGVSLAALGTSWAASRTQHSVGGYAWDFMLGFEPFTRLRRKLGEQGRAVLHLAGGIWDYDFLRDTPTADVTLDYTRDIWAELPAAPRRTSRTDLRNSLTVRAQLDYGTGSFKLVLVKEDLTQPGLTDRLPEDLDLDFVQDATTVASLGDYWLAWRKRQRFELEVGVWWNGLALEKIDHFRLANHPVLDAHGGSNLLFRIVGKTYPLRDPQTGRIRLRAIEAGSLAQLLGQEAEMFAGLHFRTHPDNDLAKSAVELVHVDEVLLPNGTRIADVNNLVAKITDSGINGLDTSTEVASTWYETHFVAKSVTLSVSGAANNGSGLIRITTLTAHGLATGEYVRITGVVGTTEANATWKITGVASTTFDLQGSIFANTYTSGGTVTVVGLLLHRAKDYLLDISETTDATQELLRAGATDRVKLAQGFKVATAGKPIERIDLKLKANGTVPASNVWITIESDSSGSPSGTVLATSDKMAADKFSTTAGFVAFFFRQNPFVPVDTSTQYHMVLQADYAVSATNDLSWRGNTSNSYANGVAKKFDGTTWAAATPLDFDFKLYVTRNDTALTLPSGYDQAQKIGWHYNNSSSDFVPFTAQDRKVTYLSGAAADSETNGLSILHDWSSFIPPGQIRILVDTANNTAGAWAAVASVPAGYGFTGAGVENGGALVFSSTATSAPNQMAPPLLTEFQAVYLRISSGIGQYVLTGFEW